MKKLLFFSLLIFVFASCNQSGIFDKNLRDANKEMSITFYASVIMTSDIQSTWHKAIYDNETPSNTGGQARCEACIRERS